MTPQEVLQDRVLSTFLVEHVPVSIYLVNGIKLHGQVVFFDKFVVLLHNTTDQLVYKHAISTIVPTRAIAW